MINLTLPFPPTSNNLFMNVGKRRIRTKRYDAWLSDALTAIREQRPASLRGSYRLTASFDRPDRRARDIGNCEKAISDVLVRAGVIEDDHLAQSILLFWTDAPAKAPGSARIVVEAA